MVLLSVLLYLSFWLSLVGLSTGRACPKFFKNACYVISTVFHSFQLIIFFSFIKEMTKNDENYFVYIHACIRHYALLMYVISYNIGLYHHSACAYGPASRCQHVSRLTPSRCSGVSMC